MSNIINKIKSLCIKFKEIINKIILWIKDIDFYDAFPKIFLLISIILIIIISNYSYRITYPNLNTDTDDAALYKYNIGTIEISKEELNNISDDCLEVFEQSNFNFIRSRISTTGTIYYEIKLIEDTPIDINELKNVYFSIRNIWLNNRYKFDISIIVLNFDDDERVDAVYDSNGIEYLID